MFTVFLSVMVVWGILGREDSCLSDNTSSLPNTDRTSSKDGVQGTKGLVRVSESPSFGNWRGRCSEWGTADTPGVVDGQVDGGERTIVAPNGEQTMDMASYDDSVHTHIKR